MTACWSTAVTDRPQFDEISELLTRFLDENNDYHREQTVNIDDGYYITACAYEST